MLGGGLESSENVGFEVTDRNEAGANEGRSMSVKEQVQADSSLFHPSND